MAPPVIDDPARLPEADNLHAKLTEVNESGRRLVRQLPALGQVRDWVQQAKKMDPKVSY